MDAFKLAAWSAEQRRRVWERDQGVCRECGTDTAAETRAKVSPDRWRIYYSGLGWRNTGDLWQADHIRPLIEGAGQDLEYFTLANLQTLCTKCHKAKTAREAGERAAARKPPTLQLPLL